MSMANSLKVVSHVGREIYDGAWRSTSSFNFTLVIARARAKRILTDLRAAFTVCVSIE